MPSLLCACMCAGVCVCLCMLCPFGALPMLCRTANWDPVSETNETTT